MAQRTTYPDTSKLRTTIQAANRQIRRLVMEREQAEVAHRPYYDAEIEAINASVQPARDAYDAAMDELARSGRRRHSA